MDILAGDDFERVLELEKRVRKAPGIAGRGNNLFVVARRPA
ncbi:hypothetical protein SALBM135S_06210 [Streptomyces alboniger]